MDKIQEAFEEEYGDGYKEFLVKIKDGRYQDHNVRYSYEGYKKGYKSANLLPTEKDCPECGGNGYLSKIDGILCCLCPDCKYGKIQIYYTPEDYKRITGTDLAETSPVWIYLDENSWGASYNPHWSLELKIRLSDQWKNYPCVIVQTNQPAPDADYKPEVRL